MRLPSGGLVRPRHALVAYVKRATTVARAAERRRPVRESVEHATRRPSARSQSPDAGRAVRSMRCIIFIRGKC